MILVFDTETTGLTLHPDAPVNLQPKMIEFGAVLLDPHNGKVEEEISILVYPGGPISAEITKITGITDADVEGCPTFIEVLPQLRRVFGSAHTMVAHNLPFDRMIVAGELARHQVADFNWPMNGICTVGLYKEVWGRNPKLLELYEWVLGKPLAQTHRALDDVLALVEIVQKEELWRLM
jgi:DNA polymerase III epsilon subunit-like protein